MSSDSCAKLLIQLSPNMDIQAGLCVACLPNFVLHGKCTYNIQQYTFESVEGISYGILTTTVPHNIVTGDEIFVDYTPIMDNTNKTYKARQYKGIEEITVTQTGSGYNVDIPPEIVIDGDGEDAEIQAV